MRKLSALLFLAGYGFVASGKPQSFDFKDPKGVNNVAFSTDAPLESIRGTATGISGTVLFDPADPGSMKGKIVVQAASLRVPNDMMLGHLRSDKWLDVAKYPEITFETSGVDHVKTSGNVTTADVTGTMTLHGVSNKVTVPVKMTFLKDKLHERFPQLQGDLLVLRATFNIKRGDYGINKGTFEDKVSDDIELTLALAGQAPR